jgi:MOSC domain-containing protein
VAVVAGLALAPVKGLRLVSVQSVDVRASGPAGDRAFVLREPDGRIALTMRNARLVQVVPAWDAEAAELALTFPDGTRVAGPVEHGEAVTTAFYDGRPVAGHVVEGPFGAALSEHAGHPVQLVACADGETGGDDSAVTLMSRASLAALGEALGTADLDGRRFRMTIEIDGVEAWEEHGWTGREVRVGDAVLRVAAPTERCAVTTRHPDDGHRDAPVLKALANLRGKDDVTFGVWCDVVAPGRVRVGDPVAVAPDGR